MDNIAEGCKLIKDALKLKEEKGELKVGLIVDCDVDGFTSSSIIYQYLEKVGFKDCIHYYIHEGKQHGLEDQYEKIMDDELDLLIVPDAGSNDGIYAEKLSCPILILDHHIIEEKSVFPNNMVVINNQASVNYKNKALSGAGVVYQFCRALDEEFGVDYAYDFIDLAALGICGDMMSGLEIENQYFWKEGFSHLKNFFILSIARKQAYSITGNQMASDEEIIESLDPTTIAFYIVPMINAMIRVGTMPEKERLFIAFIDGKRLIPCNKRGAKGTLEMAAVESCRECTNARNHQNKAKEKAVESLEYKIFKHDLLENKILFIRLDDDDDFPAALNGLVAMQLSTKYKRPTIVARLNDNGFIRGSARGMNNSALTSFKNYLNSTGLFEYTAGHDNAFGISIPNLMLHTLMQNANQDLEKYDFGEDFYDVNFIRNSMDEDLPDLIATLYQYRHIWSQQNNEPLIYIQDINLTKEDIQIMGRNQDTIKFVKNGISYIKFFGKEMIEKLEGLDEIKIEVIGTANINSFRGNETPQITIKAYEIHDGYLEF